MIQRMKTTLLVPDQLFGELKRQAVKGGKTLSALVEELLRRGLKEPASRKRLRPLPSFDAGRARVDIADRNALERAMDER
jgi:hypothetical protein